LKELETDSIKKHLYCEHTYIKYLVLAFYEEDESEPVLMIQAAKNELELFSNTHLEAWMRYVGVMASPANSGDFEIQLYNGTRRSGKDSIMLITAEPAMPDVRVALTGGNDSEKKVELRLEIIYQRDGEAINGNAIVNLRNDKSVYPSSNSWHSLKMNEVWDIDFGNDIRGGTVHLICRDNNKMDTIVFYIRGVNPTEAQIKSYITQQGYSQYWFIVKMTRQESSLRQLGTETSYRKAKLIGTANASGEPLYGKPRGFGLKQLDNWGNGQQATAQHLWNWKANIDGGVEVIREKEQWINTARNEHTAIINRWNDRNSDNPVSDSLTIIAGENKNSTILTITEGQETFAVNPSGNQRNIYDALWIKLFNGSSPYYQVNRIDANSKPRREINRSNNANKNYVHDVCSKTD
jgi:hypothetical protein